jgi:hypothetical protein
VICISRQLLATSSGATDAPMSYFNLKLTASQQSNRTIVAWGEFPIRLTRETVHVPQVPTSTEFQENTHDIFSVVLFSETIEKRASARDLSLLLPVEAERSICYPCRKSSASLQACTSRPVLFPCSLSFWLLWRSKPPPLCAWPVVFVLDGRPLHQLFAQTYEAPCPMRPLGSSFGIRRQAPRKDDFASDDIPCQAQLT